MSAMRRAGILLSMMALAGAAGCSAEVPMAPASSASQSKYAPVAAAPAAPVVVTAAVTTLAPEPPPPPPPGSPASPASASAASGQAAKADHQDMDRAARPDRARPGLGTEWGETRHSEMVHTSFDRESPSRPATAESLFYNDEAGARILAGGTWPIAPGSFPFARGQVQISLRDDGGQPFPGFVAGGKDVVVGEAGRRYSIVVHNNGDRRLEIVLSVDGLDVRDGAPASFDKRGYILDPHAELDIDGFRRSDVEVAAFRFGSVSASYAGQKYGDTRNVGVIGVAVFPEKGSLPLAWTPEEVRRRRDANPFPGEVAWPPQG
jgi:hypothetical protein